MQTFNIIDILLVEDNPDHAELVMRALNEGGHDCQIHWVKNGQEAFDFLQEKRKEHANFPEMILLDIKLPKLTGIELLKKIKADPGLSNIPVIMMTTSERSEEIDSCYQLGVNSFIVKPVKFSEFFEKVKSIKHYWLHVNRSPVRNR